MPVRAWLFEHKNLARWLNCMVKNTVSADVKFTVSFKKHPSFTSYASYFFQTTGTSMKFKIDEIHAAHEINAKNPPHASDNAGSTSCLGVVTLISMSLVHDMTRDNISKLLPKT